jgi:hypothetical protein
MGDKVVGELMGGFERGGDLREALILHWKFMQEEEENWENRAFWKLSQGTAGHFGL